MVVMNIIITIIIVFVEFFGNIFGIFCEFGRGFSEKYFVLL